MFSLKTMNGSGLNKSSEIDNMSKIINNGKNNDVDINNNNVDTCCKNNNNNMIIDKTKMKNSFYREKKVNPLKLIPQLCNQFYYLGWVSGTGGGLSIVQNGKIYCAPSGVQKERIKPEDMFILNEEANVVLRRPKNPNLKVSECLSLFMVAFKSRQANCCIHIHSIYANLVTAYYSDKNTMNKKFVDHKNNNNNNRIIEFKISNQEMIKGIKKGSTNETLEYNDTLIVPIINNVLHERDLAESMQEAVNKYPITNAVLVRDHGCYIWGKTWDQAKTMAECYDYLFKLKVEAIKCGFSWMLDE